MLLRMVKLSTEHSSRSGRCSMESMRASGGASISMRPIKVSRLSSVPYALIQTPTLVLLTVPETSRRMARLYIKGRKPTP